MQVWCFVGADGLWALSGDKSGDCLPADLGPWTFRKTVTLDGKEDDQREAEALVREHGFVCFDVTVQG
jgi:hypothetical protein